MKRIISLILAGALAGSSTVFAAPEPPPTPGDHTGNGGGDPALALSQEQQNAIRASYNLDYLKLTPREIEKRDRSLAPLYKTYESSNLASVANALEKTFGMNVYHHTDKTLDFTKGTHVSKKELMAAAVRYYAGETSPFGDAPEGVFGYGSSVKRAKSGVVSLRRVAGSNQYFPEKEEVSDFFTLETKTKSTSDYHEIWVFAWNTYPAGAFTTTVDKIYEAPAMTNLLSALKVSNLKALDATVAFVNGTLYGTPTSKTSCGIGNMLDYNYDVAHPDLPGAFDSNKWNMSEAQFREVFSLYRAALNEKKVARGIGPEQEDVEKQATVLYRDKYFKISAICDNRHCEKDAYRIYLHDKTCQTLEYKTAAPYKVVYPTFSAVTPIPQPVVFISSTATEADLLQMLNQEAPRIYAYNQLFDKKILPSVADLNNILEKYPNFLADVKRITGETNRHNIAQALQSAFLSLAYGTLTLGAKAVDLPFELISIPFALTSMLATPTYYNVVVAATTNVIQQTAVVIR